MKYGSEILAIVEGGLDGDTKKVRAYAELLVSKLSDGDRMKVAIKRRLDGSYKNDPVIVAKTTYYCFQCQCHHRKNSKLGERHYIGLSEQKDKGEQK